MRICLRTPLEEVRGVVVDLSVKGCGAAFDRASAPTLDLGSEVQLEIEALLLLEPLRIPAFVRLRREEQGRVLLGFEFADPEAVQRQVPFVLLAEFNRRASPRVTFDEVVEVLVNGKQGQHIGFLLDVSGGGLGLRITRALAARLSVGDRLDMRFHLPEQAEDLRLSGVVRDLCADGDFFRCSLRLEGDEFERRRGDLERIVARRSRDSTTLHGPGGRS